MVYYWPLLKSGGGGIRPPPPMPLGGSIDLLLGTDFADAFVDIHAIPGQPGEPVAKMNYFDWYVLD